MTPIIGIDPSVRSTGLARTDGTTTTIRPPAALTGGARLHWIEQQLLADIKAHPPLPEVAIVEAPAYHGHPLAMIRLGQAAGVLHVALHRLNVTVIEVPPSRLKRYATGKGNADKDAMAAALPAHIARPATHDECDALWLWILGQHGINRQPLDDPDLAPLRDETLAGIAWPTTR